MDREHLRDDELMHWKYLKKVRGKNGKWVYYYDKKGLKRDVKDALGYDERQRVGQAEYDYKRINNNLIDYARNKSKNVSDDYYRKKIQDILLKHRKDAADKYTKAQEDYLKTPLGKLDRLDDLVDEGRYIVSQILSKMADTIMPKEESLIKYK